MLQGLLFEQWWLPALISPGVYGVLQGPTTEVDELCDGMLKVAKIIQDSMDEPSTPLSAPRDKRGANDLLFHKYFLRFIQVVGSGSRICPRC